MNFIETPLPGAYIIELEKHADERGYFARTYCQKEFRSRGLHDTFVQSNVSYNRQKGTLRGMHYQAEPYGEVKVVTCTAGEIYDVIIDLRPDSETYCRWFGVSLSETYEQSLYIPKGFAHGFQTIRDNSIVHYQMGEFYQPDYARGVRWDDPIFGIQWPLPVSTVSEKDSNYPDFKK